MNLVRVDFRISVSEAKFDADADLEVRLLSFSLKNAKIENLECGHLNVQTSGRPALKSLLN